MESARVCVLETAHLCLWRICPTFLPLAESNVRGGEPWWVRGVGQLRQTSCTLSAARYPGRPRLWPINSAPCSK